MTTETSNSDIVVPQKRLFFAILPDPAWRAALIRTQEIVDPRLRKASRTLPANIHLTLEFLGPCGPVEENEAREALRDVAQRHNPFDLSLGDVGAFAKRRGAIVWRGVQAGQAAGQGSSELSQGPRALYALQHDLVAALAQQPALGPRIDAAERYVPHVTLFRQARGAVNGGAGVHESAADALDAVLASANEELARLGDWAFPTMRVSSVSLMWSHHPAPGVPLAYDAIATERL